MNRQELFAGRSLFSKVVLTAGATMLSAACVAVMVALLLLGKGPSSESGGNPLLVQPLQEIPQAATRAFRWQADRVQGSFRLTVSEDRFSSRLDNRRSAVEGMRYHTHSPLPSRPARWFIKPLDFACRFRIVDVPEEEDPNTLEIRVENFYPGGSPCSFEAYFTNP
jgi:hypothetical protein